MKTKTIKKIIFYSILIIILSWFTIKIFSPSYTSYKLACGEGFIENNFEIVGGFFDGEDITITCDEKNKKYFNTLRHEYCHYFINLEGNSATCQQPIKFFFEEVRCYLSEYI